ncbi:MAG: NUDIX hydrolase [Elusimicrobiaceae bacterium]|jgi:ADP-ribose pyrophosphatase
MAARKPKRYVEKPVRKNRIYKGGAIDFYADTIEMHNKKHAVREYIGHPGAVAVLPVTDEGEIVFVEQYRYPVGKSTLEIPAGKMHRGHDNYLKRARAELKEETGYTAKKIERLRIFWPCCAFSNEELHIYLATGLVPGESKPDADEFLNVYHIPFAKALKMAESGKLKDSKTIIALMAYALKKRSV